MSLDQIISIVFTQSDAGVDKNYPSSTLQIDITFGSLVEASQANLSKVTVWGT